MASGGRPVRVGLLAVGTKGLGLAEDLAARRDLVDLRVVLTYPPRRTLEPGVEAYRTALRSPGVPIIESAHGDASDAMASDGEVDLLLYAGWQRLSSGAGVPEVVLHDSLLPVLRGFNPTVTALIEGHERIGVSALLPTDEVDAGPIVGQHAVEIHHPMTIADALEAIRPCYLAAASDAIRAMAAGDLTGAPQDDRLATYSIWRDDEDYRLDLEMDAARVVRTVLALGDPYLGATTSLEGQTLRVLRAEVVADVPFEIRQPGKIWRLDDDGPVVVCGSGMVRFAGLVDEDGNEIRPGRLRMRFS